MAEDNEVTSGALQPAKKKRRWQDAQKVLSIHTHFNIFRDVHDAHTGEVTYAEQVKAIERFTRWHERQVGVGRQLLALLKKTQEPPDAKA